MNPSDFEEATATLVKSLRHGDADIGDLRVFRDGARCVSLWKPTIRERLSILFFGNVWLDMLSGETQPPVAVSGRQTYFKTTRGEKNVPSESL